MARIALLVLAVGVVGGLASLKMDDPKGDQVVLKMGDPKGDDGDHGDKVALKMGDPKGDSRV